MIELDAVQTLAFGGVALLLGSLVRRHLSLLARFNIPTPVIGGLLIATAVAIARSYGVSLVKFDTSLQSPLMIAFFTSVGFSASPALLRSGGPQMMMLLLLVSILAIVQNLVGGAIAAAFGLHPLFGVLSGSVTLTGGPATGLAFAPLFEASGVHGAASIAVAMGMAGIVSGSVLGGPVATLLIERYRLRSTQQSVEVIGSTVAEESGAHVTLKNLVILLIAMWIGSWISRGVAAMDITLPAYVGAMIIGAAVRALDESTGCIGLSQRSLETIGGICLSFFLALALMTLKLWELAGLALPLTVNLLAQIGIVILFCAACFGMMGRDYDAAVMSGGFIGFMLGTTANAVAVMRALVERYGVAPRAFLVAPIVGAFFLDFTNALIITTFVNVWR